jgi:hypothetical protein
MEDVGELGAVSGVVADQGSERQFAATGVVKPVLVALGGGVLPSRGVGAACQRVVVHDAKLGVHKLHGARAHHLHRDDDQKRAKLAVELAVIVVEFVP